MDMLVRHNGLGSEWLKFRQRTTGRESTVLTGHLPGGWSARLTLPDYGRLARHAPAIACDGELRAEGCTC